ncbi:putative ENTH/VHS/GAT family protein [Hibiscus syriacus]|uniref:ENTH/VHS/GAT family protein n=2 Tax=Hibiscus syriacus TaxID=106335 RepID=A0A6A2Z712_HIBSY|nr:putative ENTH/VHS/GAT family protein [Hibiscus syriacus]
MKKPSALFCLLLFVLNETESRKYPPECSSSCGDSLEIRYPFRLTDDPVACGDHDFQLYCRNNRTMMNFHAGLYYVKRITYDDHTIHLADINLANGSCGLPYRSLSVGEIEMDDHTGRVPCLNQNSSDVYVNVSWSRLTSYDVQKTCKVIAAVPTYYEEPLPDNISYESALKMQESGFRMRWSVECRDCRAKGRGCVYKSADTDFLYKCEAEYDYYAELVYIYTVLAAMGLAALIGFVRFILLPLVIFAFLLHKYLSTRNKIDCREEPSQIQQPFTPERFNYTDVLSMANNFKDKLGQGCFGTVYRGQLPGDRAVAVKKLESIKGGEDHFINGVSIIGQVQHSNLGLFSWEKIWEILVETGRGIEFLHGRSEGGIVHLDIKPQNILLDKNLRPRISDFGLAKLYPKMHDFMPLYGRSETTGYMAPELMISRDFKAMSCKSDVYSFGMIMLEMACGRRHGDVDAINSSKVHFPTWVYELNARGDLELENLTESDAIISRKLFIIGLWCTQTRPSERPSMTRVLEMLQTNLDDLEMPPKPILAEYLRESDSPKEMLLPETVERSS